MAPESSNESSNSIEYIPITSNSNDDNFGIAELIAIGLGLTAAGYILNKHFLDNGSVGAGRIYNNYVVYNEANTISDLEDTPDFERGIPSFPVRTDNVTYPDIMYEGVTRQPKPDNEFYMRPIPAGDPSLLELTYGEPSNVVTDSIIYEQGTPDLREDYRLTGVIGAPAQRFTRQTPGGIDSGGDNTIFTTEYSPGINEKIRRENPVVMETVVEAGGKKVQRLKRLAPLEKKVKRRFNKDYDENGQPLQQVDPVYDTVDYLSDLKLTNEDYGEGEVGGRISDESLKVYEDFLVKGVLREGYEILPSDD